jgi:hypothetical protein
MNEMKMIRQGDVLLVPVPEIAVRADARKLKPARGRVVLAQGETSLHEHTLPASDAELIRDGERMLLWTERPTRLAVTNTHTGAMLPRHTPSELPGGGLYEVRIQRDLVVQPRGMPERWVRVRD